jgi:DNA-binding GntR family transcriptional regulator
MSILLLRDNVYASLKEEILRCELPPNSELREQSLAERFVISKSPVREALLRLEQEGLVTVAPRQGYRVAPISLEDAREMFQLRKFLESACAEIAAVGATDEVLAALDVFRSYAGPAHRDSFIEYNRAFHRQVCEASGNSRMTRLAIDAIEQMERMIRFSVNMLPASDQSMLVAEHAAIIDALQSRDRRKAARLVKQHISDAERRVVSSLTYAAVRP